ncbi:MAG: metallophosphoesterase [Phycisphaerae bacterium]|nr:metallophosphoesterase [Phycisphaerae bacterium]
MKWSIESIAAVNSAIDFAIAMVVLFAGRSSPVPTLDAVKASAPPVVGFSRLVIAVVIVAAAFAGKLLIARLLGVGLFGTVYLAYLNLVVVLPAIGLAILIARRSRPDRAPRRRVSHSVSVAAVAFMLPAPIGFHATFIEPFRLKLETATHALPDARAGKTPIRIGVLADIQTREVTDYERGAIGRLMAEKPDLILIPGDIFQGSYDDFDAVLPGFREIFARLHAPAGIYCVLGDVDSPNRLRQMFEGTPIRLLINETVKIQFADRQITLGGTQLHWHLPYVEALVHDMETAPGLDDVRILFAHRPDVVTRLKPDSRIDLVVAGHTHGGQVVMPFFGPPITLTTVPRRVAAGGLHNLNSNAIYVSRGVGCERNQAPRIRLFCPPEVSIVTLE